MSQISNGDISPIAVEKWVGDHYAIEFERGVIPVLSHHPTVVIPIACIALVVERIVKCYGVEKREIKSSKVALVEDISRVIALAIAFENMVVDGVDLRCHLFLFG